MISISKNVYIDKLDDTVDEYNNTYYRTIKMKTVDVKDNTYIDIGKEVNDKDPKFKVRDCVKISKYKNIFVKGYAPNWSKEVFVIKKVKNTVPQTYVISDLNVKEIIGTFYEKELQKTNQEEFRIEKVIKKKGDKLYVKWKGYDNSFNSWIDKKKCSTKQSQYFPKPYEPFGGEISVKVGLSNYATKTDLKNATGIHTSSFPKRVDLVSLKSNVDKLDVGKLKTDSDDLRNLKSKVNELDIGKLETTPVDLSKLTNVAKNDVVKKDAYNAKIKTIEDKIPDITTLATKTTLNVKTKEVKGEIPSITNLDTTTTTALTAVKNKIPDVSNLVKKN